MNEFKISTFLPFTLFSYFRHMSLPYFFEPFESSDIIVLSEANMHYMMHVLRMKVGEQCWITNGKGIRCLATITSASKRSCTITSGECIQSFTPPSSLHLAIAFTKNPARIEWLLEKATEVGIGYITPLITHRSEKIHWKQERYEKILTAAMLQSQQTWLPVLNEATRLENLITCDADIKCIAWCEEHNDKNALLLHIQNDKKTIILVGPEGDFTSDEVHLCMQHGFKPVSLGSNRLRTETAGLYACVVYNSLI